MAPHIGTDDGKAVLIQKFRKRPIPLLMLFHAMKDLYCRFRIPRLQYVDIQSAAVSCS